jgi:hypothetical protein
VFRIPRHYVLSGVSWVQSGHFHHVSVRTITIFNLSSSWVAPSFCGTNILLWHTITLFYLCFSFGMRHQVSRSWKTTFKYKKLASRINIFCEHCPHTKRVVTEARLSLQNPNRTWPLSVSVCNCQYLVSPPFCCLLAEWTAARDKVLPVRWIWVLRYASAHRACFFAALRRSNATPYSSVFASVRTIRITNHGSMSFFTRLGRSVGDVDMRKGNHTNISWPRVGTPLY